MKSLYFAISLFYKYASFISRKDARSTADEKLINIIDNKLKEEFGPNGIKYFGVVFDSIKDLDSPQEDIDDAVETIKNFVRLRNHFENPDINFFTSYSDFHDAVYQKELELKQQNIQKKEEKERDKLLGGVSKDVINKSIQSGDSTKLYEDEENVVFRINSKQGANAIASDTSW